MKTLFLALLTLSSPAALAEETTPTAAAAPTASVPAEAPAPAMTPAPDELCADSGGLPEGPVVLGALEADTATGRRVCARTEFGLGGRLGAIVDTPHFYGDIGGGAVLFGSWAMKPTTELFATLEPVNFTFTQNATLKQTSLALGNLTAGATHRLYGSERFAGALTGRVLLPTSFEVPNNRVIGIELGHASKWQGARWLRVHTWLGADLSAGIGGGPTMPRVGGTLVAGVELVPTSWFAFVVDVTGRAGVISALSPTAALRFGIGKVGIDVGATLPLVGNDRHNVVAGLRLSWRL